MAERGREAASADWAKQRVVAASADETVLTRAYDLATAAPFPADIRDRVVRNAFMATWAGRDEEVVARRAEVQAQLARAEAAGDQDERDASRSCSVCVADVCGHVSWCL